MLLYYNPLKINLEGENLKKESIAQGKISLNAATNLLREIRSKNKELRNF